MDPTETWKTILGEIAVGHRHAEEDHPGLANLRERVADSLEDLAEWIRNGGFFPEP